MSNRIFTAFTSLCLMSVSVIAATPGSASTNQLACTQENGIGLYSTSNSQQRVVEIYGDSAVQLRTLLGQYGKIQKNDDQVYPGKDLKIQSIDCPMAGGGTFITQVARFSIDRNGKIAALPESGLPASAQLLSTNAEVVMYLMAPKMFGRGRVALGLLAGGAGNATRELSEFLKEAPSAMTCSQGTNQQFACQFVVSEKGQITN